MIPFYRFTTPLDAYEWAQANAHKATFRRGQWGWEISLRVDGGRTFGTIWATETLLLVCR